MSDIEAEAQVQGTYDEAPPERDPRNEASSVIRDMRQQVKDARRLAVELEAVKKENRALRTDAALAGLNLTPLQRDAVLAFHEGEPTPESLRATAAELAFLSPEQTSSEERAAHARMASSTGAAEPSEARTRTLDDMLREAKSEAEVTALLRQNNLIADDQ